MALGIKKITESVVEDDRSLIMLGELREDKVVFDDNKAVPNGAIISDKNTTSNMATLRVKSGEDEQVRIDGHSTLAPQTVTSTEIKDNNVLNRHLNALDAADKDRSVANHNIRNNAVTTEKINNSAVVTDKIKDRAVTKSKLAVNCVLNEHLNAPDAPDRDRTVANYNIRNGAVSNEKLSENSVTTDKIVDNSVTREKLSAALRAELDGLRRDLDDLRADFEAFKIKIQNDLNQLRSEMNSKLAELEQKLRQEMEATIEKYNLKNAVIHYNYDVVGGKSDGKYTSTPLSDLNCNGSITCAGDISGKRVYFMTYQDLAEAYVPGEDLEPGDIVAMHDDGKVYKADSIKDCVVGVISNEFANCLGASKEELFNGSKIAVGMIGKVHVKVKGPVNLGQKIIVSFADPGIGVACNYANDCIGKALEKIDCDFDEINEVLVQIKPM